MCYVNVFHSSDEKISSAIFKCSSNFYSKYLISILIDKTLEPPQCSPLSSHAFQWTLTRITSFSHLHNIPSPPETLRRLGSWKIYIFMSEDNCRLKSLIVYLCSSSTWKTSGKEIPCSDRSKSWYFTIGYLSKLRSVLMIDMRARKQTELGGDETASVLCALQDVSRCLQKRVLRTLMHAGLTQQTGNKMSQRISREINSTVKTLVKESDSSMSPLHDPELLRTLPFLLRPLGRGLFHSQEKSKLRKIIRRERIQRNEMGTKCL